MVDYLEWSDRLRQPNSDRLGAEQAPIGKVEACFAISGSWLWYGAAMNDNWTHYRDSPIFSPLCMYVLGSFTSARVRSTEELADSVREASETTEKNK